MSQPRFGGDAYFARNCAGLDTNLFFPGQTEILQAEAAKQVCQGCVVRLDCLEYALENTIKDGIWGGVGERTRRRLRRQRKLAAKIAAKLAS